METSSLHRTPIQKAGSPATKPKESVPVPAPSLRSGGTDPQPVGKMVTEGVEKVLPNFRRPGKLVEREKTEAASGVGKYPQVENPNPKPWDCQEEYDGQQILSWVDIAHAYMDIETKGMLISWHTLPRAAQRAAVAINSQKFAFAEKEKLVTFIPSVILDIPQGKQEEQFPLTKTLAGVEARLRDENSQWYYLLPPPVEEGRKCLKECM